MIKPYQFKSAEIEAQWIVFCPKAGAKLRVIQAKVPKDLPTRTKSLEEIIENLMSVQFDIAETMAQIEYYYEVANAEAVMEIYEKNPKASTTLIKIEAGGEVAQITALLAYSKFVWSGIERALMSAQSLLKRCP